MNQIVREKMEYDVVIVGAGPAGPLGGDPPENSLIQIVRSSSSRKARRWVPISCRVPC